MSSFQHKLQAVHDNKGDNNPRISEAGHNRAGLDCQDLPNRPNDRRRSVRFPGGEIVDNSEQGVVVVWIVMYSGLAMQILINKYY